MLFSSKYPIVAMAMNRVSDAGLAIATHNAGAVPSISAFNYFSGPGIYNYRLLREAIQQYHSACLNGEIIISIDTQFMIHELSEMCDMLIEEKVSHVELIQVDKLYRNHETNVLNNQDRLQDAGIKLILKVVNVPSDLSRYARWRGNRQVDGLGIKGPDGAGMAGDDKGLPFCIEYTKEHYPGMEIIAVGGIGNKTDVDNTLALGVEYIGAGTLFAATAESNLSIEAKNGLIKGFANNLSKLTSPTSRLHQNALVFSEYTGKDNPNHTFSLAAGIKTGTIGHLFAGKGIESITEIVTVNTLVRSLTKENKIG
jgi:NAD(P)H-dependent flavin oxidoreductase YrpB (nitropropane dioxygenase family)